MIKKLARIFTWNYPPSKINRMPGSDGTVFYGQKTHTDSFDIASRPDFVGKIHQKLKSFLCASVITKNPDETSNIMAVATMKKKLIRNILTIFRYTILSFIHLDGFKALKSEAIRISR